MLLDERFDHGESSSVEGMLTAAAQFDDKDVGSFTFSCRNKHHRVGNSCTVDAGVEVLRTGLAGNFESGIAAFENAPADGRTVDHSNLEVDESPGWRNETFASVRRLQFPAQLRGEPSEKQKAGGMLEAGD